MVQSNRGIARTIDSIERRLFSDYETVSQLAKSRDMNPLQERRAADLQEFRKRASQMLRQLSQYFDELANANSEPQTSIEITKQNKASEI